MAHPAPRGVDAGGSAPPRLALAWVGTLRRQVDARTAELRTAEERYRLLADNASDLIVTRPVAAAHLREPVGHARQRLHDRGGARRFPSSGSLTPDSWARLREALDQRRRAATTERPVELRTSRWCARTAPSASCTCATSALRGAHGRAPRLPRRRPRRHRPRRARQEVARLAAAIEQSADADRAHRPRRTDPLRQPRLRAGTTGYAASEVLGGDRRRSSRAAFTTSAFYDAIWETLAFRPNVGGPLHQPPQGRAPVPRGRDHLARARGTPRPPHRVRRGQARRHAAGAARGRSSPRRRRWRRSAASPPASPTTSTTSSRSSSALAETSRSSAAARRARRATCIDEIREAALRAAAASPARSSPSAGSHPRTLHAARPPRGVVAEAAADAPAPVPPASRSRRGSSPPSSSPPTRPSSTRSSRTSARTPGSPMQADGAASSRSPSRTRASTARSPRAPAPAPRGRACGSWSVTGAGMSREMLAWMFEPFFTTAWPAAGHRHGPAVVHGSCRTTAGDHGRERAGRLDLLRLPARPPRVAAWGGRPRAEPDDGVGGERAT